jgi:4-hydroxybenzoate polyprenyltransferase
VAVTQYSAAYFLIHTMTLPELAMNSKMLFLCLGTLLITAAGYVINDYYDVKIDYVNKPERVVVGKFLQRRHILILHGTLNVLGILAGILVSWQVAVINFLAIGLLWLYSNQLKRLPLLGNLAVASLTGLSVFVVYVFYQESLFLFVTYAFFAFFISLIREIIKDMEDVEGDKKFDCKTLPIAIGIRKSKLVVYTIIIIFLVVVAFFMQQEPKFWWVFSGLAIMLSWLSRRLFIADKSIDFARLSTLSKQIMILGLISMIFLK